MISLTAFKIITLFASLFLSPRVDIILLISASSSMFWIIYVNAPSASAAWSLFQFDWFEKWWMRRDINASSGSYRKVDSHDLSITPKYVA
jgi:hypothetical protein